MNGVATLQAGEPVDQYLLIKQSTKGVTTMGKPFMTLILQDKSGDIEAKLWDTEMSKKNCIRLEELFISVGKYTITVENYNCESKAFVQ